MNELALFAGAGGGILGGHLLGWRTVCAVEWEPYPASVLLARQNDGVLPPFPVWDDVRTFDGRPWRGFVDVVSGGFPCQDISPSGNGAGINGPRSSMWYEMLRIVGEVRPRFVLIENSAHLRSKGLVTVLQGLAEIGYDASWCVLGASDLGANHERKRMWVVGADADSDMPQRKGGWVSSRGHEKDTHSGLGSWWEVEPGIHRVDDGVAARVDRLKAIGNGQVPVVAATAFTELARRLSDERHESS